MSLEKITAAWERPFQAINCDYCDWTYLIDPNATLSHCPHCYQGNLSALSDEDIPNPYHPELLLPFNVPDEQIGEALRNFSRSYWLPPRDLKIGRLADRIQKVYIPAWLVDSNIEGVWQAEVGFNYDVVSHEERFQNNQWVTHEVTETKIRWEPRAGYLQRRYDNISAPAIDVSSVVRDKLGLFDRANATAYEGTAIDGSMIRLPNRDTIDAWPEALPQFQRKASEECQAASGAQHIRQYGWTPNFSEQHWTLLLLPVYSTYYLDDDDQPQPILLNGRSGQLSGIKKASMKRAKRFMRYLAILAALFFLVTMVLFFIRPNLSLITLILTIILGLSAFVPVAQASRFNRSQNSTIPFAMK